MQEQELPLGLLPGAVVERGPQRGLEHGVDLERHSNSNVSLLPKKIIVGNNGISSDRIERNVPSFKALAKKEASKCTCKKLLSSLVPSSYRGAGTVVRGLWVVTPGSPANSAPPSALPFKTLDLDLDGRAGGVGVTKPPRPPFVFLNRQQKF